MCGEHPKLLQAPFFPCAGAPGHGLVPVQQTPSTHCWDVFQEQLFAGWQFSEQGLPAQCPWSPGCVLPWKLTCAAWGDGVSTAHMLLYQPPLPPVPAVTHLCRDYLHAWKHSLKFYPLISAPLAGQIFTADSCQCAWVLFAKCRCASFHLLFSDCCCLLGAKQLCEMVW